ncbi:triose-phosphate isomerase [Paracrocinitomix mangrovi]|uniref:triose-phosphate isomerase n=1 Tax=Paracrocinitomix mangrovi TaxID=2862509 RepID=UPI001C8ECDF1|nr:triose-phosphate isomerase [Paracrocinitomix mangrovi]UKN01587.1 triose-phosphate isomerase [Paracrocinitomix mangrovi]
MSKQILAGNWKMNLDYAEAKKLVQDLLKLKDKFNKDAEVVICPSPVYIAVFAEILAKEKWIKLGAQNCYFADNGAYTGEVSPVQLKSLEVDYCIVGHSERRDFFNEDYALLAKKTKALLNHGITPIFCCGEQLQVRESNVYREFVMKQIEEALFSLSAEEISKVVIAYEPVWAIGTGKTATAEQAQEIHALIRARVTAKFGEKVGKEISIIYGGSCKPENAKELFAQNDINGGLIGGASLVAKDFCEISNSF